MSLEEYKVQLKGFGGGGQVELEKNEETGIAVITLKNEVHKNAMTGPMIADLAAVVTELEEWTTGKGVVVWGGTHTFCSGADLNLVRSLLSVPTGCDLLSCVMTDTLCRLQRLPMVSVALVTGWAVGGGAEITTACDFRLMTPDSVVQFVHARMGIVTAWGSATRLHGLVSRSLAMELLVGGRRITAEDAVNIGFASQAIPSDVPVLEAGLAWLTERTLGATEVVRAMKEVVDRTAVLPPGESLQFEKLKFDSLWAGPAQHQAARQKIKHRN